MTTPGAKTSRPFSPDLFFNENTEFRDTDKDCIIREAHAETVPKVEIFSKGGKGENLANAKKNYGRLRSREKTKRQSVKNKTKMENDLTLETRCRNPWKTRCSSTNIELSIYYDGEFLPICRRCWQEISERNLEWSSI